MTGRRTASALHAARAGVGAAYCLAVAVAALTTSHPLVLVVLGLGVVGAGLLAGCGRALARTALLAVPPALGLALVNPLVSHEGLTVLARLGSVPWLGQLDVTLEAVVYGLVVGLRLAVVLLACGLLGAAVDAHDALGGLRRRSLRTGLTAVLAVRMVPVLARDARRLEDARRCRPDGGGTGALARLAVLRAVSGGALDRAVDVAATLEVRGYGLPAGPRRGGRAPWSRHDRAFAASAVAVLALVVGGRLAGLASFAAYPTLAWDLGWPEAALGVGLLVALLAPFADRRGVAR